MHHLLHVLLDLSILNSNCLLPLQSRSSHLLLLALVDAFQHFFQNFKKPANGLAPDRAVFKFLEIKTIFKIKDEVPMYEGFF